MITGLEIKNFQSHEDTTLDFVPGVNVIIGQTDAGKSGVLRSIKWVTRNKPTGSSIRSFWGGISSVKLQTKKGSVSRIKGKADKYVIEIPGKGKSTFKAFGASVPEEVNKFLNIDEVNIQYQLDSPFLLSKSPGQVASYLNKVANLSKIDTGQQNVQKSIRKITGEIAYNKEQIEKYEEDIKKFDYLEKAEMALEVLEDKEKELKRLKKSKELLMDLNAQYYDNRIETDLYTYTLQVEEPTNALLEKHEAKKKLEQKYMKLNGLILTIGGVETKLYKANKIIAAEKPVLKVLQLYSTKQTADASYDRLNQAISTLNSTTLSLKKAEADHTRFLASFNKTFPKVCPLCGLPRHSIPVYTKD